MRRHMRLAAINGGPVVEYRLHRGSAQRRILAPTGRAYRDGGSQWRPLTAEEQRIAIAQRTPLFDFLSRIGRLP